MAAALHILATDSQWTDQGTSLGQALGGTEVSGPDTANPGTTGALPNLYYVAPIDNTWSYGLSIGVPFGSSTDYDPDWKGRYTTVSSGINVIDINPAISYRLSDKVRLGVGISVQQLTAELSNSVDSGGACFLAVNNFSPSFGNADCVNAQLLPGTLENDSTAEITGDSTALGFNLGALFLPADGIKIGVAYRHSVDHTLAGDAEFNVNQSLRELLDGNTVEATQPATQGFLTNGGAEAQVQLPATFSVSGAWQTTDKVELLTDLTWTGWSSFEELRVVFDNQFQPDSLSIQEWEDVLRFSAGINYQHNSKLTLRAGYAFDEEPIPGPDRRTARIPGNDRNWLSLGMGYQVSEKFSFDVGYTRIFLDDTVIANANAEAGGGGTAVRGIYEPSVDILSAQINWDFN